MTLLQKDWYMVQFDKAYNQLDIKGKAWFEKKRLDKMHGKTDRSAWTRMEKNGHGWYLIYAFHSCFFMDMFVFEGFSLEVGFLNHSWIYFPWFRLKNCTIPPFSRNYWELLPRGDGGLDIALIFVGVLQGIEHLYIKTKRKTVKSSDANTRLWISPHTKKHHSKTQETLKNIVPLLQTNGRGGGNSSGLEERRRELLPPVVTR